MQRTVSNHVFFFFGNIVKLLIFVNETTTEVYTTIYESFILVNLKLFLMTIVIILITTTLSKSQSYQPSTRTLVIGETTNQAKPIKTEIR